MWSTAVKGFHILLGKIMKLEKKKKKGISSNVVVDRIKLYWHFDLKLHHIVWNTYICSLIEKKNQNISLFAIVFYVSMKIKKKFCMQAGKSYSMLT